MCLFKTKKFAFSEIMRGLQHAISSAQEMLQIQQVQNLSHYWNGEGTPVSHKVRLGENEMEVPLFTLVPHSQLAMDDVEIKFKSRISSVEPETIKSMFNAERSVGYAGLQVEMDGISMEDDDVMEVTVRFKLKDTPEGMSRIMDEYNKRI